MSKTPMFVIAGAMLVAGPAIAQDYPANHAPLHVGGGGTTSHNAPSEAQLAERDLDWNSAAGRAVLDHLIAKLATDESLQSELWGDHRLQADASGGNPSGRATAGSLFTAAPAKPVRLQETAQLSSEKSFDQLKDEQLEKIRDRAQHYVETEFPQYGDKMWNGAVGTAVLGYVAAKLSSGDSVKGSFSPMENTKVKLRIDSDSNTKADFSYDIMPKKDGSLNLSFEQDNDRSEQDVMFRFRMKLN